MEIKPALKKKNPPPLAPIVCALAVVALLVYIVYAILPPRKNATHEAARQVVALQKNGRDFVAQKHYPQALEAFNQALQIEPDSAELLMDRAALKFKMTDFKGSFDDYGRVEVVASEGQEGVAFLNDATFGLALSQQALHQDPQAMKTLRRLLGRSPDYVRAYQLEGDIFLAEPNSEAAIDAYTQGLRLSPLSSALHYDRAAAYLKRDMKDQAFDDLTRAVQLDPNNLSLVLKHANLAKIMNKLKVADGDAREILRLEPDNRTALAWLKKRGEPFAANSVGTSPRAVGKAEK